MGTGEHLGVYVAIPFCRAKCSFCNFASGVSSEGAIARYVERLCEEIHSIRLWAAGHGARVPESVDTVYFGGGTPSLLAPEQLRAIVQALRSEFSLHAAAEFTVEAAPGQIADALLDEALRCGANRLSLGVQSLVDREAQAVGRLHTKASCQNEFLRLRAAGIENLGIDLIAGLPYQSDASWQYSLESALASQLDHLSIYMLEIDEDSRLGREVLGGGARLHAPAVATDDELASRYEQASAVLAEGDFFPYEISNFARKGRQSRHNQKYWCREPYLGFGLDAHSMLRREADGVCLRWSQAEELAQYAGSSSIAEPEVIGRRAAFEETVFLGLRRSAGVGWKELENFDPAWTAELSRGVDRLREGDLLTSDGQSFRLTSRGRLVAGEICGELLAGAQCN